jgi:curli biogenesis system outer membrane secretion channel CsgG
MRYLILAATAASLIIPFSALAQSGITARKPVVSVNEIEDLARTGQASVLREMIETTIINTGKFRVIEQGGHGTSILLAEQQRAKAGLSTSNTPGKIGGFEGVDFKIYGAITTAAASVKADTSANFGRVAAGTFLDAFVGRGAGSSMRASANCTSSSATLAVDVRITDGKTGEAVFAKTITQTTGGETVCGGVGHADVSGLLRAAAENVSMGLATIMYPVKVVEIDEDGNALLNYGEGLLSPGEVFALFSQGKKVIDPDTGAIIGNSEKLLGLVRITEVMPKMSKAEFATNFAAPPAVGSIAREATPQQMQLLAKKR